MKNKKTIATVYNMNVRESEKQKQWEWILKFKESKYYIRYIFVNKLNSLAFSFALALNRQP